MRVNMHVRAALCQNRLRACMCVCVLFFRLVHSTAGTQHVYVCEYVRFSSAGTQHVYVCEYLYFSSAGTQHGGLFLK